MLHVSLAHSPSVVLREYVDGRFGFMVGLHNTQIGLPLLLC